MLVMAFTALAKPIEEGPHDTIIHCDKKSANGEVEATHKNKVAWVIDPLECKWKHGRISFPIPILVWIQLPFLRENGQVTIRKHNNYSTSPYR